MYSTFYVQYALCTCTCKNYVQYVLCTCTYFMYMCGLCTVRITFMYMYVLCIVRIKHMYVMYMHVLCTVRAWRYMHICVSCILCIRNAWFNFVTYMHLPKAVTVFALCGFRNNELVFYTDATVKETGGLQRLVNATNLGMIVWHVVVVFYHMCNLRLLGASSLPSSSRW